MEDHFSKHNLAEAAHSKPRKISSIGILKSTQSSVIDPESGVAKHSSIETGHAKPRKISSIGILKSAQSSVIDTESPGATRTHSSQAHHRNRKASQFSNYLRKKSITKKHHHSVTNPAESESVENSLDFLSKSKHQLSLESRPSSLEEEDLLGDKDVDIPASYLDPHTKKWINRRRHNAVQQTNNRISAARIRQLKEIFNGFERDEDGQLHLEQFKNAAYYTESFNDQPGTLEDVFHAYDIDKNGSIDFHEFVAGMTSDTTNQSLLNSHQAFFEIATKHRRQKIIDKIGRNEELDDSKKCHSFLKLFSVNFFRNDTVENVLEDDHGLITKTKINEKQKKSRNMEVFRSREAIFALAAEQPSFQQRLQVHTQQDISSDTHNNTLHNNISNNSNHHSGNHHHYHTSTNKKDTFTEYQNLVAQEHPKVLPYIERNRVSRKLANFSIHGGTFIPQGNTTIKDSLRLKLKATSEAGNLLRHTVSLPPLDRSLR